MELRLTAEDRQRIASTLSDAGQKLIALAFAGFALAVVALGIYALV